MITNSPHHPAHNGQPPPLNSFGIVHFTGINPKWNSNQEIAQVLYSVANHPEWISQQIVERPLTGSQYIFSRFDGNWFKVDGYEWKKRREGKLIREDHMKLKVNKQEQISANYAHSAVVPTFHRRVYWLTNNPDYVLVHYLNTAENETNMKYIIDKIGTCLKINNLVLSQQQLMDQIAPIYANTLSLKDVSILCDKLSRLVMIAQDGNYENSSINKSQSSYHLERRNSCSSAFRRGLSSMALRRQPSTFSDSIDANYIGVVINNCGIDEQPGRDSGLNPGGYPSHADDRSHSGETYRSSNLDEEMSICRQQSLSGGTTSQGSCQPDIQCSTSYAPITDITPNKARMRGGTKVLIIGGWYMKGHDYSVVFGDKKVPSKLIQVGVLSVNIPPSANPGTVSVRVLCNNQLVSSSGEFTYIAEEEAESNFNVQCMIDRLHLVIHAFGSMDIIQSINLFSSLDEDLILLVLRTLQPRPLLHPEFFSAHPSLPSRTILHLAAALDHFKVIEYILGWRRSLPFTREFDPLARDGEGRTPLHVAVGAGHVASARVLVRACRTTVDVLDDRGRTPCDLSSDEQLTRLTARNMDREADEQRQLPKNAEDVEHVTSTALWVLTNGETVTDEHLLRERRQQREGSNSFVPSEMQDDETVETKRLGRNEANRWRDEGLHVEISMDTDVHVPDSPKMADLFEAVTSPGGLLDDGVRAKMALLAQQIIDALPDRIKNERNCLMEEDGLSGDGAQGTSFTYPDNNPFLSHVTDSPSEWGDYHSYYNVAQYRLPADKTAADDVLSSFSGQPSGSSFDHNHLYPQKGGDSSFASSRANTFESTSFDFDKDLGEFFNIQIDGEVDPIQQRLGDLKLSDGEQREVYGAAMVIQRAYREYRARNTSRRQADAERRAAITIQSCYRRYKQFCYFKKLHNAAIVVQKHFRLKKVNQREHSISTSTEVPEHPTLDGQSIRIQIPQNSSSLLREHRAATTIQLAYRGHRKRQAAARKIQKFMKESRLKLRRIQEQNEGVSSALENPQKNNTPVQLEPLTHLSGHTIHYKNMLTINGTS